VPGLDTVLRGGFLRGGQGSPGTGKTILASQIIYTHAAQGRRALFVTVLGENHGRMMQHLRPMRFFDPSLVPEPVKQWASAGSTARRCGVPLVSHERAHPGRTRPSSARRRSVAGWWPRRRLRLIWRRGLSDSQLAPGNTYSSNCNCPGHVGLQHTRLDRDYGGRSGERVRSDPSQAKWLPASEGRMDCLGDRLTLRPNVQPLQPAIGIAPRCDPPSGTPPKVYPPRRTPGCHTLPLGKRCFPFFVSVNPVVSHALRRKLGCLAGRLSRPGALYAVSVCAGQYQKLAAAIRSICA
jgi:KaiC